MRRRPGEGPGNCAVCGRVVLPGEPTHDFVDPDRGRRHEVVCPLCPRRAVALGWLRAGVPAADRGASAA